MKKVAVIMAGGAGERFWPLSRKDRPKQLLALADPDRSLLQEAIDRIRPLVGEESTFIATSLNLRDAIAKGTGLPEDQILAEPDRRNTLGCLCWVASNLAARGVSDALMAIVAADHRIAPEDAFQLCVNRALDVAQSTGGLVTIGITPTRAETGFGYIELGEPIERGARVVASFREKPNSETAREFVLSGRFLWNSGMFFWALSAFLRELHAVQPASHAIVLEMADALRNGDEHRATEAFRKLPNQSIDFALMERAQRVYVVESTFQWDDLGAWDSLDRTRALDADANVTEGLATLAESHHCVVVNTTDRHVAMLGCDQLVVVVTEDAVLVTPKWRAQDVRTIVQNLPPELT